ncbi:MAG TPA: hypothetical protein VNO52_06430 [Methylomirabilota bacterium]|nr:hypothetical protein [Methylomirabilota bacterium]
MRLFTFSGIAGGLDGVNPGAGLIDLGRHVVGAWLGADQPVYHGRADEDHFRSFVNFSSLLREAFDAVRLSGSGVLNEEATRLAPRYATAMADAMAGRPNDTVLILCHSQGTNNATFTLRHLADELPTFFAGRAVRCAMLDPKVGRDHVEDLFGRFAPGQLDFLFLQSEKDVLGNQSLTQPKFITEFPHGNHLWVRGLDHGAIHEWPVLSRPQHWLDLFGHMEYRRAWGQKVIQLRQKMSGKHLGTMQLLELDAWTRRYAKERMNLDPISEALMGFLQGALPEKFRSHARGGPASAKAPARAAAMRAPRVKLPRGRRRAGARP